MVAEITITALIILGVGLIIRSKLRKNESKKAGQ